ncbi:Elongation of very long chain fatty acids protein, partial [Operophtera brumata]
MLVSSPIPIFVILYVYHRFVKAWGPAIMKDRPPFQLKNTIIAYNIIQIALSCITRVYLPGYYSMWCQKIINEDTPMERDVVSRVWLYYMIKVIDLMDT